MIPQFIAEKKGLKRPLYGFVSLNYLGRIPYLMRSNIDILSRSWDALGSKWILAIGLSLLHVLVSGAIGTFGFGLGTLLVGGALSFGFNRTMVQIYRGETPALETYFDGFRHFLPTLVAYLILGVATMIGFVLLIIPGIIVALGLSQVYFVMQDRPELGVEGSLKESWRLTWTNGNMLKVLGMGFLALFVVIGGALALGVGLFIAIPLVSVMSAGLYEEIRLNDPDQGRVDFV